MQFDYPVNEIFRTLQGEGYWQGVPSVFVRLQGCDVGCPWCDTKHTWALEELDRLGSESFPLGPRNGAKTWASLTPLDVATLAAQAAGGNAVRHVVLTGGEPAMHRLTDLVHELRLRSWRVQLETSGTRPVAYLPPAVWVTLSPKVDMPGGYDVLDEAIQRADEIKHPVGKPSHLKDLRDLLKRRREPLPLDRVSLQPLSMSPKATALCIEACLERGYRLSAQLHKFVGLP